MPLKNTKYIHDDISKTLRNFIVDLQLETFSIDVL